MGACLPITFKDSEAEVPGDLCGAFYHLHSQCEGDAAIVPIDMCGSSGGVGDKVR